MCRRARKHMSQALILTKFPRSAVIQNHAMDDLSEQIDEIEALVAIYGKEWQTDDEENRAFSITIGEGERSVRLHIKLPHNYPSTVSPLYEISAPHLSQFQKNRINDLLDEVCVSNIGQNVIFQLVEKIREAVESDFNAFQESEAQSLKETLAIDIIADDMRSKPNDDSIKSLDVIHGDVIVDRKSSFQGHTAIVKSIDEVKQVLRQLYENKKIKQATHNMYAYRIFREDIKSFVQDCEDDGESQAGSRLLHLLQIMEAKDVMVVVSRWYGGIHLGVDRFRHINNVARQVLTAANLIPEKTKKKS